MNPNFSISSFKKYLLFFFTGAFGILAIFAAATEVLVDRAVEPNDTFISHVKLYHTSNNSHAAFGDSHTAWGFTGDRFFDNLAYEGEDIKAMYYKIKQYYAELPPQQIIIQADPHMFAAYRAASSDAFLQRNFSNPRATENDSLFDFKFLSHYHKRKLFAYWGVFFTKGTFKSNAHFAQTGWLKHTEQWHKLDREFRHYSTSNRVNKHKPRNNFSSSELAEYYQAMLEFLLQKKADICLVTYPVSAEYIEAESAYPEFAEALMFMQNLAGKYNLKYFNYHSAYKDKAEYFANQDHLNTTGARLFTEEILDKCFSHKYDYPTQNKK